MKAKYGIFAVLFFVVVFTVIGLACNNSIAGRLSYDPNNPPDVNDPETISSNLASSLHGTSRGMQYWYEHEDGFGPLTGVSYAQAGCGSCHVASCQNCHSGEGPRANVTCITCHARQGLEAGPLQIKDVHLEAGMVCADCHGKSELHGDGNIYNNMFEAEEIRKDCSDCHATIPENTAHQMHAENIHCDSCHVETVVTCYNCHFESLIEKHEKRPYKPFSGFTILANSTTDDKVHPVTYQSVVYKEYTFVAFGPYHGHAVKAKGHDCSFCHQSARIQELNDTGKIKMTEWFVDAGTLTHAVGMIPFVPDKFEFQYMDFDADTQVWTPSTTETDKTQYLYIEPLTTDQLEALGYEGD